MDPNNKNTSIYRGKALKEVELWAAVDTVFPRSQVVHIAALHTYNPYHARTMNNYGGAAWRTGLDVYSISLYLGAGGNESWWRPATGLPASVTWDNATNAQRKLIWEAILLNTGSPWRQAVDSGLYNHKDNFDTLIKPSNPDATMVVYEYDGSGNNTSNIHAWNHTPGSNIGEFMELYHQVIAELGFSHGCWFKTMQHGGGSGLASGLTLNYGTTSSSPKYLTARETMDDGGVDWDGVNRI
jgi:hypothetical protein